MTGKQVVALAAGGTGGHVFPAQAVADALRARGFATVLLTDVRGARYAEGVEGLPYEVLPAATIRGTPLQKLGGALTLLRATMAARAALKRHKARLLVGFGGYPAFAPTLAARTMGLPIVIQEQGTTFSLANAKLLRFARRIAISFPIPGTESDPRVTRTGPAVRPVIAAVAGSPYPPLDGPIELLAVGGSQSASVFGHTIPDALLALPEGLRGRMRLSLQYKGEDEAAIREKLAGAGIACEIAPFFHDMAPRLVRAHLVISRAGASTMADIAAVGRPAILVPIPGAASTGEQRRNALAFEKEGAGWHLAQGDLEQGALGSMLARLLEGDALPHAAAASAALGMAGGADAVAAMAQALLGQE